MTDDDEEIYDAYDVGVNAYYNKELYPPKEMDDADQVDWWRGYRGAYKQDLSSYER